jgi:hypothetical protein
VDDRVEVTAQGAADVEDDDDAAEDLGGAADIDGWDVEGAFGLQRLGKDVEWHTRLLWLFCTPAGHGANGVDALISKVDVADDEDSADADEDLGWAAGITAGMWRVITS